MRHLAFFILAGLLIVWHLPVNSQETNVLSPAESGDRWPIDVSAGADTGEARVTSVLELCMKLIEERSSEIETSCKALITEAIEAQRSTMSIRTREALYRYEHTKTTLDSQLQSGRVIFWVVLIVVFLGLCTAALQFARGLQEDYSGEPTEVTISANELKFKTSWLGALILAMSMGFLALYLVFVFPVSYVGA